MNVFDAVRTVLAVRSFEDRAVPAEVTRKIAEAAHLSASSMNKQPWHFIVVEDRAMLQKLGQVAKTGPYIAQAPMAVAIAIDDSKFAESDASRAAQSMMLTAWEAGIGSNWAGWYGLEEAGRLLGVPDGLKVLCIIPFGYPAQRAGRGKKNRKPLSEVVSRERFGTPFS